MLSLHEENWSGGETGLEKPKGRPPVISWTWLAGQAGLLQGASHTDTRVGRKSLRPQGLRKLGCQAWVIPSFCGPESDPFVSHLNLSRWLPYRPQNPLR